MKPIAELLTATDRGRFRFGDPIRLRMRQDGSVRLETWRDRWIELLASFFWPRGTFVVTAVDTSSGTITVGPR